MAGYDRLMNKYLVATTIVFGSWVPPAVAGVYTDEMSKCLVASTSAGDKESLVRWIFANAALHPAVASIATVTSEQRTSMNQSAGQLFDRLLTDTCRKQTREALQYEGPAAIQLSFQVLGQVAMGTLMAHPAVGQGFSEFAKFVDEKKIEALRNSKE
jgi:hypothetical protein